MTSWSFGCTWVNITPTTYSFRSHVAPGSSTMTGVARMTRTWIGKAASGRYSDKSLPTVSGREVRTDAPVALMVTKSPTSVEIRTWMPDRGTRTDRGVRGVGFSSSGPRLCAVIPLTSRLEEPCVHDDDCPWASYLSEQSTVANRPAAATRNAEHGLDVTSSGELGERSLCGDRNLRLHSGIVKRPSSRRRVVREVNRELVALTRMFTLPLQGGKLITRPYIPRLKENNVRTGFFEPEQFQSVKNHLPVHMRAIVAFAHVTGWRTPSEILPLEWRQVDMKAGEVRLDAGTTKNGEGRVFPFTTELRRVLEDQQKVAEPVKKAGIITPPVFVYTVGKKAGQRITESGFNKAWRQARVAAGCPGRIPHDFRRTAVRNLVRAGVPERVAMQLTGHKTRAVFERYNIVSAGDLRDAAQRLDTYASAAV